jgi:nucleosome binding factor SPN SPT16 subunit
LIQEQEAIYHLLLELQTELLDKLQDGVTARDVYQHAISYIREKKPDLEKNFVKNVGFGVSGPFPLGPCLLNPRQMGLEFRDSAYILSSKNARELKTGMVMNLTVGFQDLIDNNGKKCAI